MSPSQNIVRYLPYLLSVVIFMQQLDTTILNTAIPTIAYDLGVSPLVMHSVVISYTLALAVFTPISGFLSDRFGTRTLFQFSIFFFTIGSLLCALAPNFYALLGGRVIQGLGGAFLTPVARLALIKTFPRDEIMPIMNFAIMPALLGPLIGPALGGYIVEYASWHWIFLINIPMGILAFIAGLFFMPNLKEEMAYLDLRGFIQFGLGVFLLVFGFDRLSHGGQTILALLCLVIGSILFIRYWLNARENEKALFPTKLWLIRTFRLGVSGSLFARIGVSSIPFLVPIYLQIALGYSPAEAGFMLIPLAAASLVAKPFIPPLLRYFGYRKMLTVNTLIIATTIILIALFGEYLSKGLFMGYLFIMGFANSCQFTMMNTVTIARLRPYNVSAGNTLMVVNQQLAISFGVALVAFFLNIYPYFVSEVHVLTQFKFSFWGVGFATFGSAFIFMRLHPIDGDNLIKNRIRRYSK